MSIRIAMLCALLCTSFRLSAITIDEIQGIYVGQNPSSLIGQAVGEINNGLDALYGKRYIASYTRVNGPAIVIGPKAAMEMGLVTAQQLDSVGYGGYVIRTTPNAVVIAGKSDFATIVGCQEYIRRLGHTILGGNPSFTRAVRVTTPPATRILPDYSVAFKPSMPMRNYYNREDQARPDVALARVNPELVRYSDLWVDHSAGYLIPKDLYYDSNPEYFAEVNGRRVAKNSFTYMRTPLCLSNPDVLRISAERALLWVAAEPERVLFPITHGDTRIWCECTNCLALDHMRGHRAGRMLNWVNHVADAVGARYPHVIIVAFAYNGSDMAPSNIVPRPNVMMMLSTGLDMPFYGHREKVGALLPGSIGKIKSWHEIFPGRIWVCEYSEKLYHPAIAMQLEDRIRWYDRHGVSGIMYSYGYPTTFKALWTHIYGRLMMDLNQSAADLTQEFALQYYGDGGLAMARFFRLSNDRYRQTLQTVTPETFINGHPADYYTDDFVVAALDSLQEAMDKTPWEITRELRPEMLQFALDALRRPGPGPMSTRHVQVVHRLMETVRAFSPNSTAAEQAAVENTLRDAGVAAERERPGTQAVVEGWLNGEPVTQKSRNLVYTLSVRGASYGAEGAAINGEGYVVLDVDTRKMATLVKWEDGSGIVDQASGSQLWYTVKAGAADFLFLASGPTGQVEITQRFNDYQYMHLFGPQSVETVDIGADNALVSATLTGQWRGGSAAQSGRYDAAELNARLDLPMTRDSNEREITHESLITQLTSRLGIPAVTSTPPPPPVATELSGEGLVCYRLSLRGIEAGNGTVRNSANSGFLVLDLATGEASALIGGRDAEGLWYRIEDWSDGNRIFYQAQVGRQPYVLMGNGKRSEQADSLHFQMLYGAARDARVGGDEQQSVAVSLAGQYWSHDASGFFRQGTISGQAHAGHTLAMNRRGLTLEQAMQQLAQTLPASSRQRD